MPITTKAGPMPTHQCLRTDDGEDVQDRREPSVELDEKPTVGVRQPGPTLHLASQNNQLLPERRILGLKPAPRLEWRNQHGQHKGDQRDHAVRIADSLTPSKRTRFSVHTGCLTRPLCSGRIAGLHRSYGSVRPSAPLRYARLAISVACASPLASERLVPAVPRESPDQIHAPFTPVAACPVIRHLAGSSQEIETPLVSTTNLWVTTRQRRFTFVRLSDPYLPEVHPRRFDPNAAESARGVSPRAAHRSGLDTLASSGSCHPLKTAVFRRLQRAPPISR